MLLNQNGTDSKELCFSLSEISFDYCNTWENHCISKKSKFSEKASVTVILLKAVVVTYSG